MAFERKYGIDGHRNDPMDTCANPVHFHRTFDGIRLN